MTATITEMGLRQLVAAKLGVKESLVAEVLNAICEVVYVSVAGGESVSTPLGKFHRRYRLGRELVVRGKRTVSPSHYAPVFTPSHGFKRAVRKY